jgi:UDPglucose 6-dehydrogenase
MKIGVIGGGFVGLVTAACLANSRNKVTCVEIDKKKIKSLRSKKIPFFEPGLKQIFDKKFNKSLFFSDSYDDIDMFDLIFITVGTPFNSKGVNLHFIENSIKEILKKYKNKKLLIVIKSTIPPGTTNYLRNKFFLKFKNITLINNPEFLREGNAVEDFINPDRIIIGIHKKIKIINKILDLYKPFQCKKFTLSYEESEVSKYYSNSFFASLISFSNQFAYLCDSLPNCNFKNINATLLADKRIVVNGVSPDFKNYLIPGIGFGGSCFPKDIAGIKQTLKSKKINNSLLKSILEINDEAINHGLKIIKKNFNKKEKICILGASFKENSNDTRKSRTIYIANKLKKLNFNFDIIDPKVKVIDKYKCFAFDEKKIKNFKYFILMTKWRSFKKLYKINFNRNIKIIDFRNYFEKNKFKSNKIGLISVGSSSLA